MHIYREQEVLMYIYFHVISCKMVFFQYEECPRGPYIFFTRGMVILMSEPKGVSITFSIPKGQ